jgi:hypothetical protein
MPPEQVLYPVLTDYLHPIFRIIGRGLDLSVITELVWGKTGQMKRILMTGEAGKDKQQEQNRKEEMGKGMFDGQHLFPANLAKGLNFVNGLHGVGFDIMSIL